MKKNYLHNRNYFRHRHDWVYKFIFESNKILRLNSAPVRHRGAHFGNH